MAVSVLRGLDGKIIDLANNVFGTLPIANGGTGATTVANAKLNLNLDKVDNTADANKAVLSATKLATARTVTYTGDAAGTFSFDGSSNISTALTLATTAVTSGAYNTSVGYNTNNVVIGIPQFTVDAKGRLTSASVGSATINTATTTTVGVTLLTDSTTSTSITSAATPNSVKKAYDQANLMIPLTQKGTANGVAALNSSGVLDINKGGTGASDAATARTNLGLGDVATQKISNPANGYWSAIPIIQSDGVVEFGKYIDFHATNESSVDYHVRLFADASGYLACTGWLQLPAIASGAASYKKGWRKLSATLPSSAGEVSIAHGITTVETVQGKVTDTDGLIVFNNDPDPARQFYIRVNGANLVLGVASSATKIFGQTVTIYAGEEL